MLDPSHSNGNSVICVFFFYFCDKHLDMEFEMSHHISSCKIYALNSY